MILDRDGARTWLDCAADHRVVLRAPTGGTLKADPPEPAAA